jgi:hypothetical protein
VERDMHQKKWTKLTREEQDLYLTLLWKDGHSEKSIANFFRTTKGSIVRRRHTGLKLSTSGRGSVKQVVNPERFRDLLDIHRMDELRKSGVVPIAPVTQGRPEDVVVTPEKPPRTAKRARLKLAASERSQCNHKYPDGGRCGYEKLPGKDQCALHDTSSSEK